MKHIAGLLLCLCLASVGGSGFAGAKQQESELPKILVFKVTPRVISPGGSAMLEWETRGVTSVTLGWGTGNRIRGGLQRRSGLLPSGTLEVKPQEDTIYVLECNSAIGQACASASVTVRVR